MSCAPKRTCRGRPIVCPGPCNPRHRIGHRKRLVDNILEQEGLDPPEEEVPAQKTVGQVTSFRDDKLGTSSEGVSVTELTSVAEFTMIGVTSVARIPLMDRQTSTGAEVLQAETNVTDNRTPVTIPQFRIIGVPQSATGLPSGRMTVDSGASGRPIVLPYRTAGQSDIVPNRRTQTTGLNRPTPSTAILIIAPIIREESSSMSSLELAQDTMSQEVSAGQEQEISDLRRLQEQAEEMSRISPTRSVIRSEIPTRLGAEPEETREDLAALPTQEETFGGIIMVSARHQEIQIGSQVPPTCGRIPCVNKIACKMAAAKTKTNAEGRRGKLPCFLVYLIAAIIYTSFHALLGLLAWENPTYQIFLSTQICGLFGLVAWGITGTLPI